MRTIVKVIAATMLIGFTSVGLAEGGKGCKGDVEKFCKDVKPGGGRIIKCLKEHESELSETCKKKEGEMKEHMKEAHEACKGDIEKLCKGIHPGEGRIVKCLKEHEAEVSAACKATKKK